MTHKARRQWPKKQPLSP